MKMRHRGCGGEVVEDAAKPPYVSEEYGTVPAFKCERCGVEIVGDLQIEMVPESEADRIQVEAFRSACL